MKLFSVEIALFRKPGTTEVTIPAFSADLAENKARKLVNDGKLYNAFQYEKKNPHTGADEIVKVRERITGFVQEAVAFFLHGAAFHRRVWNETKGSYQYPAPNYNGRRLTDSFLKMYGDCPAVTVKATAANDAKAAYSVRAKLETRLKAALKAYKGDFRAEYEVAFRAAWSKIDANRPAPKKRGKQAKLFA